MDPIVSDLLERVRACASTDGASPEAVACFREAVWEHAARAGRSMPWRETDDPYRIWLSEVMLQQTQIDRVRPRYETFVEAFPTIEALADAPFEEVLRLWKGLGYNRRALALSRTAHLVVERHGGSIPSDRDELLALPGIGEATAAGIRCFAFGEPDVYLETNVRAAVIFAFFPREERVHDRDVVAVVALSMEREDPRRWFYALMDLGAALKRTRANPSRRSAHHARQAPFEGSDRQIRGRALELLLEKGPLAYASLVRDLAESLSADGARASAVVDALVREGLLARDGEDVRIS
jgi:A/G-specific adenine glycosylase